jgi:hypothetical protein
MAEDDIRRIVANPYYCLRNWAVGQDIHEPLISEEDWIKAGVSSIKQDRDNGKTFLRSLLENLKGNQV